VACIANQLEACTYLSVSPCVFLVSLVATPDWTRTGKMTPSPPRMADTLALASSSCHLPLRSLTHLLVSIHPSTRCLADSQLVANMFEPSTSEARFLNSCVLGSREQVLNSDDFALAFSTKQIHTAGLPVLHISSRCCKTVHSIAATSVHSWWICQTLIDRRREQLAKLPSNRVCGAWSQAGRKEDDFNCTQLLHMQIHIRRKGCQPMHQPLFPTPT
jgi:hypothetical protein